MTIIFLISTLNNDRRKRKKKFGVGQPAIRSRVFGVGHAAIQSRTFGVGPTIVYGNSASIRSRAPQIAMSHFG